MTHPPLANAELAVMELLWAEDRLTARAIRERLYPTTTKAQHGTVQRLLQRLEDKGFVRRDRTLPVHLFSARVGRESYAGSQLESLAEKLTGGSVAPLITHLLAEKKMSRREIDKLRRILEDHADGGEALVIDLLLQITLSNIVISSGLALAAWAVQRSGRHPRVVHLLWLVVLVKLVTPPVLNLPLLEVPGEAAVVRVAVAHADPADVSALAVAAGPVDPAIGVASSPRVSGKAALIGAWLLGSAFLVAWSLLRIVRFHRLLAAASRVAPAHVQRLAAGFGARLGLAKTPTIYVTSARVTPLVWWIGGRVRIVVPDELLRQSADEELTWVVAHELAHVRRRDHLVRWLEWLACVLCWWNPVARWARQNLRRNEEVCTDALVLSTLNPDPRTYASSLLAVVEYLSAPAIRPPAMASGIDGGGFLERRLKMIISGKHPTPLPRWLRALAVLGVVAILPLGIAQAGEPDYQAVGDRLEEAVRAGELTTEQAAAMMAELARAGFEERMEAPDRTRTDGVEGHYQRLGIDHDQFARLQRALAEGRVDRRAIDPALGGMLRVMEELKHEGDDFELDPELKKYFTTRLRLNEEQVDLVVGLARRALHRLGRKGAQAHAAPTREEMARVKQAIWAKVESGEVTEEAAMARWEAWLKRVKDAAAGREIRRAVAEGRLTEEEGRAKMAALEKMAAGAKGESRGEGIAGRFQELGVDERALHGIKERFAAAGIEPEQMEAAFGMLLRLVHGMKQQGEDFEVDPRVRAFLSEAGFSEEQQALVVGVAHRIHAGRQQPAER